MIDPRTPELEAWIDGLATAWQQVVIMHALGLAYPYLRACDEWQEKIAVIEDAMHLAPEERERIVFEAADAAKRLKPG